MSHPLTLSLALPGSMISRRPRWRSGTELASGNSSLQILPKHPIHCRVCRYNVGIFGMIFERIVESDASSSKHAHTHIRQSRIKLYLESRQLSSRNGVQDLCRQILGKRNIWKLANNGPSAEELHQLVTELHKTKTPSVVRSTTHLCKSASMIGHRNQTQPR